MPSRVDENRIPETCLRYSVVIPVFNEAACLEELHRRLMAVADTWSDSFEIIYVDDGSRDETPQILERLCGAPDSPARFLRFARNFGQHPAVIAGFESLRGEIVVTLDADLQNPPEEIPKLLAALEDDVDVVAGVRAERQDPWLRKLPSRVVNWMVGKLTGVPLRDYGCLLRVYRRPVIEALLRCREQSVYFTALVSWLGVRIREVEVEHAPREAGESKYNWLKLITMNFDLLTGYSNLPIQLISLGGIAVSGIGFALALVFFVLGWAYSSLGFWLVFGIGVLSSLVGLQLIALGFIGEYIGRILMEVKQRPFYLLESEVRSREKAPGNSRTP